MSPSAQRRCTADRLKEEAEALSHSVERLQQRLEQRGRGLARVRKRGALTELGAERDRAIARRDDLRDRLAAVDAATDGLPDRGELGDLLDRHEDLDAQLRRAATGRMFGYQAAPPPYLTRALGPPPADGPAHDLWERTATAIEHHRLRWQVTDPTGALGDPAGNRRMQRACAQLRDEIRRTVEYLERGRALHRSRGRAR